MEEAPNRAGADDDRANPDPADEDAVRVRTAGPLDGAGIASVHVASIRELGARAYDEAEVDAWAAGVEPEAYPLDRGRSSTEFVVAEAEDGIVGFGCLELVRREITAVYVHPDHTRAGIGAALLDELEARARDDGIETLTLTASKNAVPFYRAEGYEPVGPAEHETGDGTVLECVLMRTEL